MKYLGIDYGGKRVGVAVSDAAGSIAFPRAVLPNDARLPEVLAKLVADEGIGHIVIGDTRTVSGAANPVTAEAENFAEHLARETGVPVSRAFEAWSSIEASRYAPEGKGHDDAAAAAFILQRFLDMRATK
jgi:putative Holliday junction resolvase